ncbi:MAG: PLP-dependent transferase [Flavobacteriales bacterium]|jgi:cystathionine beta-lyase/cystathionine gamma-synthase|nr:PLP-dependent transferase [Flavobacteriales bacterium]
MENDKMIDYLKHLLPTIPSDWLTLTTHRLDIYDEAQAKFQFLEQLELLYNNNDYSTASLNQLPTAYDYIRLGHPLSSVLEWGIAKINAVPSKNVITFSSQTIPLFAILRKNLILNKKTQILYTDKLPSELDTEILQRVYHYDFELKQIENIDHIPAFDGSTILLTENNELSQLNLTDAVDFYINLVPNLGSILVVNGTKNNAYVSSIQHVRRRETIAMTPANTLVALKQLVGTASTASPSHNKAKDKTSVLQSIQEITNTTSKAIVASSGLSTQYAIVMGLIDYAFENYEGKAIKIVVPPNCYGGTNDQARRIAACYDNVSVMDLPVDGDHDMVQSTDMVLDSIAKEDAVPLIIAEIPTNPRVEVPDLIALKNVLSRQRTTENGAIAVSPVFILDQTFCPNVHFLGDDNVLSTVQSIAYVSGSKFPSGGKCTAGYCVANNKAAHLMDKIEQHLLLCDNEATDLQYEILAQQLPSMNQRIKDAYSNTRKFVDFIQKELPAAKINFVSEALANEGFTPSVFSLDLPTQGDTAEERELYKRTLNNHLINLMITKIPHESKYCVSYGQLKGCYWTIPATSTQGTTKEDDKDYIARVALSPNMDLELHQKIFLDFVEKHCPKQTIST